MNKPRIAATEVFMQSFSIAWREKTLVIPLASFIAILSMIFLWPVIDAFFAAWAGALEGRQIQQEELSTFTRMWSYFVVVGFAVWLLQLAAYVIWSRASILGYRAAMQDGAAAMVKRGLWMLWRWICGIGWMMVLALAGGLVLGILMALGGISSSSGGSGGAGIALMVLLLFPGYVALFLAVSALSVLIMVSIHGEVRDVRLPIHQSFGFMKGNLLRAAGTYILITIFAQVGLSPFFAVFFLNTGGELSLFGMAGVFILFFAATVMGLIWVSFGALYAVRLVPALKAPQN